MKLRKLIIFLLWIFIFPIIISSCATKKRVLVIECPSYKPSELNKEGFKNESKREKSLEKNNKSRRKDRN